MLLRNLSIRLNRVFEAADPAAAPVGELRGPPKPALVSEDLDAPSILSAIGEVVYNWNIVTDKLSWGANAAELLGPVADGDLSSGLAYAQRVSARSFTSRYDAIFGSSLKDDGYGVLYEAVYELEPEGDANSDTIWVEDCGRWFQGPDGRPARAQGVIRAVTERRERERLRSMQSKIDPLTGTLNRMALSDILDEMLASNNAESAPFAILLAAVENLFSLNCAHGFDVGDEVIAALAARIRESLRSDDIAARYAGGKFALILRSCDAEDAQAAAQRLIESVSNATFETSVGQIRSTICVGGVIAPRDGRTAQILLQHAEESLDFARLQKGESFANFESALARDDRRTRSVQVADGIVSALNERRVELAFQPIIQAHSGTLAFHEALLRIRVSEDKIVTPGAILPVAEKSGLLKLLDHRVLDLAMSHLLADPDLRISINAAVSTLHGPEWPELFSNALAIHSELGDRLILEITETALIEDFDATRRLIALCKRHGVKIAMDDFGTGHTSFRNLRELAFDLVKIDGVFVQNLAQSRDDRFFVRTLIELAHHIGMKVVAEWVENEETAQILRDLGADFLQGTLYGGAEAKYVSTARGAADNWAQSALSAG
jgi:diguanylate cyclase (GGDEF)-like protein